MRRIVSYFNALLLGVILGMMFVAIVDEVPIAKQRRDRVNEILRVSEPDWVADGRALSRLAAMAGHAMTSRFHSQRRDVLSSRFSLSQCIQKSVKP